jgi:hypothetical protein
MTRAPSGTAGLSAKWSHYHCRIRIRNTADPYCRSAILYISDESVVRTAREQQMEENEGEINNSPRRKRNN